MAKDTLVVGVLSGYDPDVGAALWRLEDTRERTLRELQGVPAEAVDVESGGNSIGTILYHVALIETDWLFSEILEREASADLQALLPADDRDPGGCPDGRPRPAARGAPRPPGCRAPVLLDEMRAVSDDDFHRPANSRTTTSRRPGFFTTSPSTKPSTEARSARSWPRSRTENPPEKRARWLGLISASRSTSTAKI